MRDEEYAQRSPIETDEFLGHTDGLYVKKGWGKGRLRGDLEKVLKVRGSDQPLWLMVNYGDGANPKTADRLQQIVREVLGQ